MQRWNLWGDESKYLDLPGPRPRILHDLIGEGQSRPDYAREKFIERIPESRLEPHPLISIHPKLQPFPASAAGPDLRQALLGSEGRMGVLTNVVVKVAGFAEKGDVYGAFFSSWERLCKPCKPSPERIFLFRSGAPHESREIAAGLNRGQRTENGGQMTDDG